MNVPAAAGAVQVLPRDLSSVRDHSLAFGSGVCPYLHPAPGTAFVGHHDRPGLPDEPFPVSSVRLKSLPGEVPVAENLP